MSVGNPLTQLSIEDLRARSSMKWRVHPPDVLPLWVAEMDVPLAEPVAESLRRAVDLGDTGYPHGREYATAVSEFAAQRWGWDQLSVDRTAIVPDVMLGIVEVLRLLTGPGDPVVVCPPVYPPFFAFVTHADREVVEAPLGSDLRLDLAALEEAFRRARSRSERAVFLLCNPHNPTGVVHTRQELESVAELARRHGVRVVADEIHAPLVLPGATFVPFLSVDGAENGFALSSASKGWNLAGIKAALLIAGPDATEDLARLPEEVSHGPSHLGVIAHTAAFRDGGAWLDALLAGLDTNRQLLGTLLGKHLPQVTWTPPEATYLAWLDCRALDPVDRAGEDPAGEDSAGDDSAPGDGQPTAQDGPGVVTDLAGPARLFLEHGRVALSSGHVFGTGGTGHVRLNFATSPAILAEAVARMARATTRW